MKFMLFSYIHDMILLSQYLCILLPKTHELLNKNINKIFIKDFMYLIILGDDLNHEKVCYPYWVILELQEQDL